MASPSSSWYETVEPPDREHAKAVHILEGLRIEVFFIWNVAAGYSSRGV